MLIYEQFTASSLKNECRANEVMPEPRLRSIAIASLLNC